ncbi:hypothetical protein FTO70_14365 [Methanosarcina sp. KYL-1]|uniref:hypothetical protein n=1 Tax=Methanosarcina sp. KYL-1 TaxID=2602068 RepID=UPI0021013B62|nr:hypothetical protein [Methanosarcina sp. KYL-1]MCQ1536834.1 hypothetical protein [Methanosarcina sp. KYL-1]
MRKGAQKLTLSRAPDLPGVLDVVDVEPCGIFLLGVEDPGFIYPGSWIRESEIDTIKAGMPWLAVEVVA